MLNEEAAIGSTISQCLDAREEIKRVAGLDDIEIIVVSDGSTDRTVEIARGFDEIDVIVFEKNRGYGAARPAAWASSFLVLNAAAWLSFWVWISGNAARFWRKVTYTPACE